jgi:hypothetical protein
MEFNFSTNNSMTEFETLDNSSTIYLGFASQPETNIFSQKYFRSPHASTTESLIKKLELLERPKKNDSQVMMHQGLAKPCQLYQRDGKRLHHPPVPALPLLFLLRYS